MTHLGRFRNVVLPYDAILCDCSIVGFFFPVTQWGEIFPKGAFVFTFLASSDPLKLKHGNFLWRLSNEPIIFEHQRLIF